MLRNMAWWYELQRKEINSFEEICEEFDLILLGPQISYKRVEFEAKCHKPILPILPVDYATGNVMNIFKQIHTVFYQKP